MSNKNSIRLKLVNAIIEYAGDEFEDKTNLVKLAGMSEEELLDCLIHIIGYYHTIVNT